MVKLRSTLAILLFLSWTAAPALRCLVPGETLNSQEEACCKSMGGQCGDSPQSDHPCCKRLPSIVQPALVSARASVTNTAVLAVSLPAVIFLLLNEASVQGSLLDASPPPQPTRANPVLRI